MSTIIPPITQLKMGTIIQRRPKEVNSTNTSEVVLVDRGEDCHSPHRYVTGVIDAQSVTYGEWYWGHYFKDFAAAQQDFWNRP